MASENFQRHALLKRAIALSWFTIVYNLLEGAVAIGFGVQEESVALAGFGVDSWIEVASAFVVLWRFRGEAGLSAASSQERERRATFAIGLLFLLLAAITLFASGAQLVTGNHPETTWPGILVSSVSLSFMFFLYRAKMRVGEALKSRTMLQDAACSRACIQLSVVLFVGSLIYLVAPALWWADAAAAALISFFVAKEGWETVRAARSENFADECCDCG